MTRTDAKHDRPFTGLTPLMERFVREYVRCGNAKRAATLAGYSVRSAKQIGHSLLKLKSVQIAIEELRRAGQSDPEVMTPDWILQQFLEASADPNPRVRLDALKSLAQAAGLFGQGKKDPEPCQRCAALHERFKGWSTEELRVYSATGMTTDQFKAMSDREFDSWVEDFREKAEVTIRLTASVRSGIPLPQEPESEAYMAIMKRSSEVVLPADE